MDDATKMLQQQLAALGAEEEKREEVKVTSNVNFQGLAAETGEKREVVTKIMPLMKSKTPNPAKKFRAKSSNFTTFPGEGQPFVLGVSATPLSESRCLNESFLCVDLRRAFERHVDGSAEHLERAGEGPHLVDDPQPAGLLQADSRQEAAQSSGLNRRRDGGEQSGSEERDQRDQRESRLRRPRTHRLRPPNRKCSHSSP